MLTLLLLSTLQILFPVNLYADDHPTILWERLATELTGIYDIAETSSGELVGASLRSGHARSVVKLSSTGDIEWYGGGDWYYQKGQSVVISTSGDAITTGLCHATENSSIGLFILSLDMDGNTNWSRLYDFPDRTEKGYDIVELPDGGFGLCGVRYGVTAPQVWVLRTDALGDTLWTATWGANNINWAHCILYAEESLKVLAYGRIHPDSGRGPHLLTYDLSGNLVSEIRIRDLEDESSWDMCLSSTDDCYTMITYYHPDLCHVDDQGNLLWARGIPSASQPYGYSINSTMDGGYIYGGQNTPDPDVPGSQYSGMIVKFDSDGQEMWRDYVYNQGCECLYSACQLSQGGYVAVGAADGNGFVLCYAPEVGIEEGSSLPGQVTLHQPLPNPFTSSLSVSYSLPESMHVSLSVYDISGRLMGDLETSVMEAGEHTSVWDPGVLPSGCYVIRMVTEHGEFIRSSVLIR